MPGQKLFTAWMTSTTDGHDHAVTDEEFAEHRPEPEALCGAVLLLAPMEWPPGERCPRCVAFLSARESLRDLDERLGVHHRHQRPGWLYRLVHANMGPLVPRPRTGARHGPKPSTETEPGPSVEAQTPAEAAPTLPASVLTTSQSSDAVTPASARPAAQPSARQRPSSAPLGLGGTHSPVDAACSPAAAPTGPHDGTRP